MPRRRPSTVEPVRPAQVAADLLQSDLPAEAELISESERVYGTELQQRVLSWYSQNGRRLPWRETRDAYRIWLSEIMLQQTTVAAVIPYFERFAGRFPTVAALAGAAEEEVLRSWEGLGYYSRARNLHRAARLICGEYGGEFPRSVAGLQQLPGVGRYTAGAIAAFAWDLPAAILEANTERLYSRLTALEAPADSAAGRRQLWRFAEAIVPRRRAGDFNQALMDLGSRICTPTEPHCGECPLADLCRARGLGRQVEFPKRRPRAAITEISELAVVLERGGEVLLRQRGQSERWAGLYDFPRLELSPELLRGVPEAEQLPGRRSRGMRSLFEFGEEPFPEILRPLVRECTGIDAGVLLGALRTVYSVTRYRVSLVVLHGRVAGAGEASTGWHWHSLQALEELPLPTTGRKIVQWLRGRANDSGS